VRVIDEWHGLQLAGEPTSGSTAGGDCAHRSVPVGVDAGTASNVVVDDEEQRSPRSGGCGRSKPFLEAEAHVQVGGGSGEAGRGRQVVGLLVAGGQGEAFRRAGLNPVAEVVGEQFVGDHERPCGSVQRRADRTGDRDVWQPSRHRLVDAAGRILQPGAEPGHRGGTGRRASASAAIVGGSCPVNSWS
jgi:hypothetical protein